MKVNYTTASGRVSVELNGDTQREIFEQLSTFQEVFDETVCGKYAEAIMLDSSSETLTTTFTMN